MLRTELRRLPLPALALASTHSTRLASAGAGAAVALAYAGLCLLLAHPAVAPGSEGYGYTGATGLHGLLRWDGAWYAGIADHGYALGSGRYRAIAFFPLFPALVAAAHHLLPFVSIAAAGTAINIAATVAAAVLIGECLGEWRSRDRLLAIVAILLVPSAFFDVAFYS